MRFATTALVIALFTPITSAQVTIKATNKLPIARASQTIELTRAQLQASGARDLPFVHIKDSAGNEVLAQAVDTDFDESRRADIVIFQADFAPNETKTFTAANGARQAYQEDQIKAHGRFVRERFDDFAWENDRIAHRTYGKGLAHWKEEALISSTIDIWSKRTPKMVVDKWYMTDNYHADHGEGADFYSAGLSRGCGGNGLWVNNQLFVSENFINTRVLAKGPIRVLFELDYEAFSAGGTVVTETKRISLDAGSQLDRFTSTYKPLVPIGRNVALVGAAGLKKQNGEQKDASTTLNWIAKWERVSGNGNGNQGMAVIGLPNTSPTAAEDNLNHLITMKTDENFSVSYYAGFCWDKAGHITTFDDWKKYLNEFAQGIASPIEVTIGQ